VTLLLVPHSHPQDKVDNNRRKQGNSQNGRTKPIVKASLAPHAYAPSAPVESKQGVYHGHHGDEGKQAGGDFANLVTKVEEADCETAEDDSEVEP
jgi:hypothetical protein